MWPYNKRFGTAPRRRAALAIYLRWLVAHPDLDRARTRGIDHRDYSSHCPGIKTADMERMAIEQGMAL